jgi:hypothetical protein
MDVYPTSGSTNHVLQDVWNDEPGWLSDGIERVPVGPEQQ